MAKPRKGAEDRALTPEEKQTLMELALAMKRAMGLTLERLAELLGCGFTTISRRGTGEIVMTRETELLYRLMLGACEEGLQAQVVRALESVKVPRDEQRAVASMSRMLEREGRGWLVDQVLGITPVGFEPPVKEDHDSMSRSAQAAVEMFEGAKDGVRRRMKVFKPQNRERLERAMGSYEDFLGVYRDVIADEGLDQPAPEQGEPGKDAAP